MARKKVRAAVAVAIIGGLTAVGAVNSFAAAPLSEASSNNQGAAASAAGLPGVVTVSESTAAAGAASWSAVSVAGTSVVGRDSSGAWAGPAGALGGLLETLNAQTCAPTGGPLVTAGVLFCLNLLQSDAGASPFFGAAGGSIADLTVVRVDAEGGATGGTLVVAPSTAGSTPCQKFSGAAILAGFLLTPSGTTPLDLGLQKSEYNNCAA